MLGKGQSATSRGGQLRRWPVVSPWCEKFACFRTLVLIRPELGSAGTATRTVGLLGGILTYAVEAGIIESNPAHGIRKPKHKHESVDSRRRSIEYQVRCSAMPASRRNTRR
jgi:hypothetical protein